MKTALQILKENLSQLIEMAEIDKVKASEVNSFALKNRAEGQIQAFNIALKEIEELLPTEREQKKNDFIAGMEFIPVDPNKYQEDAEQYFKETYNE